jgi:hypothetical protein
MEDAHVLRQRDLGFPEDTGEDDREETGKRVSAALSDSALDFNAAESAVVEIGGELGLEGVCAVEEGALAGVADLKRSQVGEDAQHGTDIRMEDAPVADGEVQSEVLIGGPGTDDLGVGGEQHVGGGESVVCGLCAEAFPVGGGERGMEPSEARIE